MIKKIYICLFLAISFLNGYAQKRTNIDDNWLFHYGNSENAKEDFNYSIVNIFSKSHLLLEIKHTSCIYYNMILTETKIKFY